MTFLGAFSFIFQCDVAKQIVNLLALYLMMSVIMTCTPSIKVLVFQLWSTYVGVNHLLYLLSRMETMKKLLSFLGVSGTGGLGGMYKRIIDKKEETSSEFSRIPFSLIFNIHKASDVGLHCFYVFGFVI